MLYYLYYKLYKATLTGSLNDIAPFATSVYFGGLIATNIFVINSFVKKLFAASFFPIITIWVISLYIITITISYIYFIYVVNYKGIIDRYSQESEKQRIKGNIKVAIYVGVSFLLMFIIPLYKPGVF